MGDNASDFRAHSGRRNVAGVDNRAEVQQFLTALRNRLSPEAAGLTWYTGERRVPGLRREEVAQLAGMSTAYYTRMERGDLSGVSESVLHALGQALQLNEAESAHLRDLAQAASTPRPRSRAKATPKLPPRLQQLLDSMPDVPALVMNELGDPVASNRLGRALFCDLFDTDSRPLNHTRYLFLDPRARKFYPDWENSAREAASAFRLTAGREPVDAALVALVGELSTQSVEFRRWWGAHTVRLHHSGIKVLDHPLVGRLEVGFDAMPLPAAPGLVLITYLPAPHSPSHDALRLLANITAAEPSQVEAGAAG